MIWGRKRQGNGQPPTFEDRYRAVARLVARRGFKPRGLVLIEVDGGFLVRGLRGNGRGTVSLASDTIAADEVLAELADYGD